MDSVRILKTEMSITNIDDVAQKLLTKQNYSVAICNANTLVRCYKNIRLNKIINSFDIKCTDGFPVAKASKILYKNNQKRVDGYKLFLKTIEKGLEHDVSHYFFGNSETVVLKMIDNICCLICNFRVVIFYTSHYKFSRLFTNFFKNSITTFC